MFQTQFRICASYLVTVLLIESQAESRNVLPVLKRGPDDSGVTALAGALPVSISQSPPPASPPHASAKTSSCTASGSTCPASSRA